MTLPRVPASAFALVASNLLPLAGVLLLGWDLGLILLLYWAESGVVLLFSLLKLAQAAGLAALFLVPFFVVHAGGFMVVHLLFLLVLFVHPHGWGPLLRGVGLGVLAFLLSHGYSYVANHRRKGEAYGKPQDVMGAFYGRVVVMHLTILFGGWIVLLLGQPAGALAVLVLLKTGVDLAAHLRERRKRAPKATDAAGADGTGPSLPS